MKKTSIIYCLIGTALLLTGPLPPCLAADPGTQAPAAFGFLFIVTTTDDHNDGVCDSDCTLREAILAADNAVGTPDEIRFNVTGTINLTSALPAITDDLTINGPGADQLTVRRSANTFRIFNVTTPGVVGFSGLTIFGGAATGAGNNNGGGIQNLNRGTVSVINCTLSSNFATLGGGIYNSSIGTVNVTNCTLSHNDAATFGAGIYNNSTGTVNIGNCTLSTNHAVLGGGGLFNYSGTLNVTDSTLNDNYTFTDRGSSSVGGGVYNLGGTATVINSTIRNSSASFGGGIFNEVGTITIIASTISGNFADAGERSDEDGAGGGIYTRGTLVLSNSTVSGNGGFSINGLGGGGIFNEGSATISNSTITGNSLFSSGFGAFGGGIQNVGALKVKSSIIALNSADSGPDVAGAFTSAGFNLIGKKDGSTGFTAATDKKGTIASPLNPKLDPKGLRNNGGPTQTVALIAGSPAIDKGTSAGLTGTLTIDQRGFPRTVDNGSIPNANGGDGTDIGAFEFGAQ